MRTYNYFLYKDVTSVLGLFTAYVTEYQHAPFHKGKHFVLKFPNGYGASIIPCGESKKYWELAVLDSKGHLCYTTPITEDVLSWLEPEELQETLKRIYALPESK